MEKNKTGAFRRKHESFSRQRSQLNSADIVTHGRYNQRKSSSRSEEIKQISSLNKRLHLITKMDEKKTSKRSNVQKRGSKDDKKRMGFTNKSRSESNLGYSLTQKSGGDRNNGLDFSRKFSSDTRISGSGKDKDIETISVCSEPVSSSEDSRRRVFFTSKSKSGSKIGYSSDSGNIHSEFLRSAEDKNTETTVGSSEPICSFEDSRRRVAFMSKSKSDSKIGYSSGSDRNMHSDFSWSGEDNTETTVGCSGPICSSEDSRRKAAFTSKSKSDSKIGYSSGSGNIHSDFSWCGEDNNTETTIGCSEPICSSEDSRRRVAFTSKSKSDSKIGYSSGSDRNIHSDFSRCGEDKNTETTVGCSEPICCSKDSGRRVAVTSKFSNDNKIGYISGGDRNLGLDFSIKLYSAKSIHLDFPTSGKDKAETITRCPDSIYSPEDNMRRVAVTSKFSNDNKIGCSDGHNRSDFSWSDEDKSTEMSGCSESICSSRDRRVAFTNKSSSDRKIGYDFMRKLESDRNVASDFLQTFGSERNIYLDFSSDVNESMGRNNLAVKGNDNDKSQTSIANFNRNEEYDTFENQLNSKHRIRAIPIRRTMVLHQKACSDDQSKPIANKTDHGNKKVQWKLDDNKFLQFSSGQLDKIEVPTHAKELDTEFKIKCSL